MRFEKQDLNKYIDSGNPDPECIAAMVLRGCSPSVQSEQSGMNAFHFAAGSGNLQLLKLLLDSGESGAACRSRSRVTPWQTAVMCGKFKCAELLRERGLAGNSTVQMVNTGRIFNAIAQKDHNLLRQLIQNGFHPLHINASSQNILQYAVAENDSGSVEILLESGVDPQQYSGVSPLEIALENKNDHIFVMLLEHGADPDTGVKDKFNRDSLLFVKILQHLSGDPEKLQNCFRAMLDNGWNPEDKTPDGDTASSWMEKWNEGSLELKHMLDNAVMQEKAE